MSFFNSKPEVLAIDDDQTVLTSLKFILRNLNFNFRSTQNPAKAIKMVNRHTEAILLDWMMEEMDGLELLKELKSNPKTKDIPVIMITGKKVMSDMETAYAYGADGYLTKPLDPNTAPDRIMVVLEKAKKKRLLAIS